jgi:hypothetical protein
MQIFNAVVQIVIHILIRKPEVKRSFVGPRHDGQTVLNCLKEYGMRVVWFHLT